MNIARYSSVALVAGIVFCAGCSKKEEVQPVGMNGVDIPRLQAVFTNSTPEIASELTKVSYGVRYGDPVKSLAALDQLVNNPNLSEPQKKVVNETIEQVKKLAQQPPAAGQ